uniref:hypothetical protein n=1 Tax=Bordetella sputigena TaxID=1416810 RepID=UPI0039F0A62C
MKIGRGREVLSFYDWLPGHGESEVEFRSERTDVIVAIQYDAEDGLRERELRFTTVCAFNMQAFPGPRMFDFPFEESGGSRLLKGGVVEYPDSDASRAWINHFGGRRVVKHYSLILLSENKILTVFAAKASLSESRLVD